MPRLHAGPAREALDDGTVDLAARCIAAPDQRFERFAHALEVGETPAHEDELLGGGAVEAADPPGLWVSFLVPKEEAVRADVVTAFCHYVHFFSSERTAAPWLEQHPDAFLVPLSAALEVGRLRNRLRYGTALDAAEALKRPTSPPCR